jgi:muramoyltetrapeptide carboxypeptidase
MTIVRGGDKVALVAPASWMEPPAIDDTVAALESWGLRVDVGAHADDRHGFMAGTDEDRLADLNAAVRDPEVRAVVALRGGCGSLRLVRGVDVAALRTDPKPLVGFSDITALHQVWTSAGVPSVHGAPVGARADDVRRLLLGESVGPVVSEPDRYGAVLTTTGQASGLLSGGNLEMLARSVGVVGPALAGHVLLLEITRAAGLGMVDRALTQLLLSGTLDGVVGVALGELQGFDGYADRDWTVLDVLADRLGQLGVPILAGLPIGHLDDPVPVPLGVGCTLDADAGTLTCGPLQRSQ